MAAVLFPSFETIVHMSTCDDSEVVEDKVEKLVRRAWGSKRAAPLIVDPTLQAKTPLSVLSNRPLVLLLLPPLLSS